MRSRTCEEVDGTSYMVRNIQFRTLRFYWCSKKWRNNYQKCFELVMNMRGRGEGGCGRKRSACKLLQCYGALGLEGGE
jgi:hypothetical protein